MPNAYLPALCAPSCTPRLLHDEVADILRTYHPLPYVRGDETQPAQLILMHVWCALWGRETHTGITSLNKKDLQTPPSLSPHTNIMAAL